MLGINASSNPLPGNMRPGPSNGPRRCWCGGRTVYALSGDQNPGGSPIQGVAQLVERFVRGEEAGGSRPPTLTNSRVEPDGTAGRS